MIAVAMIACLIQTVRTAQHWSDCMRHARHHAMLAGAYRTMLEHEQASLSPEQFRDVATVAGRLEAENRARQRAWEYAASRPWLQTPSQSE
jgi:hypothetical protein